MTSTLQPSPILRLPAELRQQIYTESYSFIFKRPLTFDSQSSLSRWLTLVGDQNLHHVTAISLQLQDIDLSPLLSLVPMPGLLCWELYEDELEGVCAAFRKLPNVRSLSLARSTPYQLQSYLYREFLRAFCGLLGGCWSKLGHLTLHEDIQHFNFITSLQNLRSVRLVGYSDQHTAHAFSTFSHLSSLKDIQLVTEDLSHSARPYGQRHLLNSDEKALASALSTLPPLNAFTIHESPTSPSVLTSSLLSALTAAHAPSLTALSLSVSCTPFFTTLTSLHTLLEPSNCRVQQLELCWPDIDPEILESLLPRSLERLRVSVEGYAHAFDLSWAIIQRRSEVPKLCEVALVGEWEEWDEEGSVESGIGDEAFEVQENELELAIGELMWLGVRTVKGRKARLR